MPTCIQTLKKSTTHDGELWPIDKTNCCRR